MGFMSYNDSKNVADEIEQNARSNGGILRVKHATEEHNLSKRTNPFHALYDIRKLSKVCQTQRKHLKWTCAYALPDTNKNNKLRTLPVVLQKDAIHIQRELLVRTSLGRRRCSSESKHGRLASSSAIARHATDIGLYVGGVPTADSRRDV
ncbi:hypothetical protein CBL_05282 [Carabus blaptoides fortunei]